MLCPTALLANWKREISLVAPVLRALVVDSNVKKRLSELPVGEAAAELATYDVVVTAYTLLGAESGQFDGFCLGALGR